MGVADEARAGRVRAPHAADSGRDAHDRVNGRRCLTNVLSIRPERFNEVAVAAFAGDLPDGSSNQYQSDWTELA